MSRIVRFMLSFVLFLGSIGWIASREAHAADYVVAPQIATGYYHTLALHTDGTVYSWGQNTKGQLGNGSTAGRMAPILVSGLSRVKMVATGIRSSYAVKDDGTLWAWGMNENGQLGDGTTENRLLPVQITGIEGSITALSSGVAYHMLALTDRGEVWAWGLNTSGELGLGSGDPSSQKNVPVKVPGLTDVVAVAAGGWHSLALKSNGTVWAWGNNEFGSLGDGTLANSDVPKEVDIDSVVAISAGNSHSLAVKADGTVWSWGLNTWGMLGDGTGYDRREPVRVLGVNDAKTVVGGGHHSYALTHSGSVWTWGYNNYGEMGDGTGVWRYTPVKNEALTDVIAVTAGGFNGFAMQSDGTVRGWGLNSSGELGDNTLETRLVPVVNKAVVDLTPPTVADSAINASDITNQSVTLSWAKAADNLSKQSELRYRLYRVGGNSANTVAAIEAGTPVGPYEEDIATKTVAGLFGGQTYHFAVVVQDKAGRKSVYPKLRVKTVDEPEYFVVYEGNGSTGGEPPLDPIGYWEGEGANVLGNTGGLVREGYAFGGWNTERNGTGTLYQPGDTLVMPTANVTLHAQWIKLPDTEGPSAFLDSLALTNGRGAPVPIGPAFTRNVYDYSAEVVNGTASVTVTASVYDSRSSVTATVYGHSGTVTGGPILLANGVPSASLPLDVGNNRIELDATAENGGTLKYVVRVTRASAPSSGPEPGPAPSDGGVAVPPEPPADEPNLKASVGATTLTSELTVRKEASAPGRTKLTASFDSAMLLAKLGQSPERPRLIVEGDRSDTDVDVELTGRVVRELAGRGAILEVDTPFAGYELPLAAIGEEELARLIGRDSLDEAIFAVSIASADAKGGGSVAIAGSPAAFSVRLTSGGTTKELETFGAYARRYIPLPEGMAESDVSTAAVLEPDGSVRHVPTRFEERNGRRVAVASSLTNGVYALVRQSVSVPVSFSDMERHWAKEEVSDLASRLVLRGGGGDRFRPGATVTRAEFVATLARALGLSERGGGDVFKDVPANAWYAGAAAQAAAFGLVEGDAAGAFRPTATVTREEAAAMLDRAMRLTGLGREKKPESEPVAAALAKFSDAAHVSGWARDAFAAGVAEGLFQGDSRSALRPKAAMTRAETAAIVRRLLQRSELID